MARIHAAKSISCTDAHRHRNVNGSVTITMRVRIKLKGQNITMETQSVRSTVREVLIVIEDSIKYLNTVKISLTLLRSASSVGQILNAVLICHSVESSCFTNNTVSSFRELHMCVTQLSVECLWETLFFTI